MKNSEIGLKEKIGYGLGDAASSMFWKLFGIYLLFFYTDIFGLPAAVVGTMFLITRIWDAVNDPIFGAIADRTHSRWGKFRPYLLWGALPFGVCGVFLFLTPDWSPGARTVYAYVTYTLMMMVYSFINVPYASLLGVMTSDTVQRTQLSSSRMIFAFVGSILVLAAVDPLLALFDRATSGDTALNWTLTVAVFAVIAILLFLLCFSWTRERVVPIKESDNRLWDDLRDLSRNKPWWILIGAGIGVLICNSIRDGAAIYYFKYYVSRDAAVSLSGASFTLTSVYLVLGQAACIAGILLAAVLSRRFGKKPVFAGAMALATVLSAAFFFLSSTQIAGIMILQVLISTCLGSIFPPAVEHVCRYGRLLRAEDRTPGHRSDLLLLEHVAEVRMDHRRNPYGVVARLLRIPGQCGADGRGHFRNPAHAERAPCCGNRPLPAADSLLSAFGEADGGGERTIDPTQKNRQP